MIEQLQEGVIVIRGQLHVLRRVQVGHLGSLG
jgi:hypothetical protein